MAIKGRDFYDFAGALYAQAKEGDEALLRSVVSRSYYGAFLEARTKAGLNVQTKEAHEKTATHFLNKGMTAVGNRLNDLRLKRNAADYDIGASCEKRDAGKALAYARNIIDELNGKPN